MQLKLHCKAWICNAMLNPNHKFSFCFAIFDISLVNVNGDRTCPVQPESICLFCPTDSIDPSETLTDIALASSSLWWVAPRSPWDPITISQGEYLAPTMGPVALAWIIHQMLKSRSRANLTKQTVFRVHCQITCSARLEAIVVEPHE